VPDAIRGTSTDSEHDLGDTSGLALAAPSCPLSFDEPLSRETCRSYELRVYSRIDGDE